MQTLTIPQQHTAQVAQTVARWCECNETPTYSKDWQSLDEYVYSCVRQSRFFEGMINQAAQLSANRAYTITGGQRTINRFRNRLSQSAGGQGFRHLLHVAAQQYLMSNFGAAVYIERNTEPMAFRTDAGNSYQWQFDGFEWLENLDPLAIRRHHASDADQAHAYPYTYPSSSRAGALFSSNRDLINRMNLLRVGGMPDWRIGTSDLYHSAAYRCCQVMNITGAIYSHIQGCVDPSTVKGFVTLSGVSQEHLIERKSISRDDAGKDDIIMLFSPDGEIDIGFQSLSRMPDNLDLSQWLQWGLTECAIELGLPLEEFIGSHASSLLGQSGAEVEAGMTRATSKGGGEFTKHFHEMMRQLVIPATLDMQWLERDSAAELAECELHERKIKMLMELYEARQTVTIPNDNGIGARTTTIIGDPIITKDQALRQLIRWGCIDEDIFAPAEDSEEIQTIEDDENNIKRWRDEARASVHLRNMAEFEQAGDYDPMNQPVVRYTSQTHGDVRQWFDGGRVSVVTPVEREIVLYDDFYAMHAPQQWQGFDHERPQVRTNAGPMRQKRQTIDEAVGSDEHDELRDLFDDALTRQYEDAADGDDPQPLTEYIEEAAVVALLIALARQGIDFAYEQIDDLSEEARGAAEGVIEQWAQDRSESLLSGEAEPIDDEFYPLVPNTLDESAQRERDLSAIRDGAIVAAAAALTRAPRR